MKKAVFLDRDGVVNKAIWRENKATGPRNPNEWQWGDGIHAAIRKLKDAGYLIFIITNQPDVSRKVISLELMEYFHHKIKEELAIDEIMICLHDDAHECDCRKPKPGMLLTLAKKWNLSLTNSYFIGDTIKDVQAGKAAGCFTLILDHPYNADIEGDLHVKDLKEAVDFILKGGRSF